MDDLAAILAESPPDIGTDYPPELWDASSRPVFEGPTMPGAGPIVQPQNVDDAFLASLGPQALAAMPSPRPQSGLPTMPPLQLPRGANVGEYSITEHGYSPEENDARYALDQEIRSLTGERGKTAEDLGDVTSEGFEAQANAVHDKAIQAAIEGMELDEATDTMKREMSDAKSEQDAAHRAYRDYQFRDYWADRTTGQKILAGIGIALGAFASGVTGRRNDALDIVNGAIERDFKLQAARLNQLKQAAELAGLDVADVEKMHRAREASLKLKFAAGHDAIAAKFDEAGLRSRSEAVRLQATQAAQDQRMKALEKRYEAYKPVERDIKMTAAKRFAPVGPKGPAGGPAPTSLPVFGAGGVQVAEVPVAHPRLLEQAQKSADQAGAVVETNRVLRGVVSKLRDNYKAHGATINPLSDAAMERDELINEASMSVKILHDLGAIQGKDSSFIEGMVSNTRERYMGSATAKLKGFQERTDERSVAALERRGVRNAREALGLTKPRTPSRPAGSSSPIPASPGPGWQRARHSDGRVGWGNPKTNEFAPDTIKL